MTDSQEKNPLEQSVEDELAAAQRALAKAKERAAALQQAQTDKAIADAAERRAAKERAAAEERARHMAIEEAHRIKKQKAEDERRAAQRRDEEEQERLQAHADQLRREQQEREKREAQAKQIAQEAFLLEQENARIAAELNRNTQLAAPSPADPKEFPTNDNLAFDPVVTGKFAADDHQVESRSRLFHRTAQQQETNYNEDPVSQAVVQPAPQIIQSWFKILRSGKLDHRVFRRFYGPTNEYPLFQRGEDALLVIGLYRWHIEDGATLSRNFFHFVSVVVDQLPDGTYYMSPAKFVTAGTRERVKIAPVCLNAGVSEMNSAELHEITAVDQDDDLVSERGQ